MTEMNGKVALVTGAASGIGRATALSYAREGAQVVVSDVDTQGGEETVRLIEQQGGQAIFVRTDVSNPADCQALVERTLEAFGRLDYACNNAGIGGESNPVDAYSIEGWQKVIDVNLLGVFYCMKYEIPAIRQAGGGAIVNMASILGQVGFPQASAYVAAKHGVLGLTKTAAMEVGTQGIRVNAVGPAFIHTPMIAGVTEDQAMERFLIAQHPIGRLGEAQEVAELVIWLSSEKASFITGAYYPVDGGYLAR